MKKSKFLFVVLVTILITSNIFSQTSTPLWTKEQFPDINIDEYYYGIGKSKDSQDDADAKARQNFALNVEVKVKSDFEDKIQETNKKYKESSEMTFSQVTDVTLRGITITERYKKKSKQGNFLSNKNSGNTYYSLILIQKDEYEKIIKDEIDRAIEIREKELEEYEANQKLTQQKEAMDVEHRKKMLMTMQKSEDVASKEHDFKMKQKEDALSRKKESIQLLRRQRELYSDFLDETPPHRVIDMYNGELIPNRQELYAKLGIVPFSFDYISYAYRLWLLEFDMNLDLNENKPDQQNFYVRFQLLPNQGTFWKTSLAFGYVESTHSLKHKKPKEIIPDHSPFLSANVTLPSLYHSYLSMYGDFNKLSLGINNFLPYKHFNDRLSLLLQLDFIMNNDYRNEYNDAVVCQFGFRFVPVENLTVTLAFENNDMITFSTGFTFGKKISL